MSQQSKQSCKNRACCIMHCKLHTSYMHLTAGVSTIGGPLSLGQKMAWPCSFGFRVSALTRGHGSCQTACTFTGRMNQALCRFWTLSGTSLVILFCFALKVVSSFQHACAFPSLKFTLFFQHAKTEYTSQAFWCLCNGASSQGFIAFLHFLNFFFHMCGAF